MIVLKAAQEKFLGALQAVSGIVERRHTLPILANVLIRKNGPQIEFTTSDLEIQVRTSAELGGDAGTYAATVGARKLILPRKTVLELQRLLRDDKEGDEGRIEMRFAGNQANFSFGGMVFVTKLV